MDEQDLQELAFSLDKDGYHWSDVIELCEIVSRKYRCELTLAQADRVDKIIRQWDDEKEAAEQ